MKTVQASLQEAAATTSADHLQMTTFFLGEALFGISALQVQEILPYQEITPVPLAPQDIRGLINLRGQIVTVLDLRSRFGLERLPDDTVTTNLVVQSDEGTISLCVDTVANVIDVPSERLMTPPGTVRGIAAAYIEHVCQLEDHLLLVVDLKRLIQQN